MKRTRSRHPGFSRAAQSISKRQHIPMKRARAILAYAGRHASAKAKRANPRLRRISGA